MQPGEQTESEELTLPEIFTRYKDNWIALIVTTRDKNSQPAGGKVVANDIDRYRLRQKLLKYPDICILYAGEPAYPLLL
jgi:hypothetical protein